MGLVRHETAPELVDGHGVRTFLRRLVAVCKFGEFRIHSYDCYWGRAVCGRIRTLRSPEPNIAGAVDLPSEHKILSCFDALDDLSERFEGAKQGAGLVKSLQLELGPLAELLVLRRDWLAQGRNLLLDGTGDARHAAIRTACARAVGSAQLGAKAGAFQIRGSGEAGELAGHDFALAAGRYAQEAGMPGGAARLLKGAFAELISNVSEHAGEAANGIAAYDLRCDSMWLAVADSGQGVVRGYVSNAPDLAGLDAAAALRWAVVAHRSRFSEPGRGTGFSTVMRAMLTLDAALRVRSDDASIEIEGGSSGANWVVRDQDSLNGFVVSLHVRWQ